MVTCTEVRVPSAAATEKVSETELPTFRLSKALLAVKLQAPAVSMLNVPMVPTVPVCATKVAGLSTSLMVSVPPVVSAALVSSRATTAEDRTAASLVPLMVMTRSAKGEAAPCASVAMKGMVRTSVWPKAKES